MTNRKPAFTADAMAAQAETAANLLKAIANPQRLRILCMLIEGECTVSQINEQVSLSQSALSQHLAVLRQKSLVATRKQSQAVFYSVPDGAIRLIIQTLHDIYCPSITEPISCSSARDRSGARIPK
jgi:ArsR family transcriptional regulator, virulence genes transcriptional regulator